MADLPTLSSLGEPPVNSRWLWAVRIGTLLLALLFCVISVAALTAWEGAWILIAAAVVVPLGLILWGLRTNPPGKLSLALAVGMGLVPSLLAFFASLLTTQEALSRMQYYGWSEPIWGALLAVQAVVLATAIVAYVKLTRGLVPTPWLWAVQIAVGASILLASLALAQVFQRFRRLDTWVTPASDVLVLLGLVLVYGVVLWALRSPACHVPRSLGGPLTLAIVTSAVLFLYFIRSTFSSIYYIDTAQERTSGGPFWTALSMWIFTLAVAGYTVSAARVYFLMRRRPGDIGRLFLGVGVAVVCGGVFFSGMERESWRARRSPERLAAGAVRFISGAELTYASTYDGGYSPSLQALGPPEEGQPPNRSAANLIDPVLAGGRRPGYQFTYVPGTPDASGNVTRYTLIARPLTYARRSRRSYFSDETGVIRYTEEDRGATAQDPPLPR